MILQDAILSVYPRALECNEGHAEPTLVFYQEADDDRYYIMVLQRCTRCNMPVGGEDYACPENQERFYAKLEPLPQHECGKDDCTQPAVEEFCHTHKARKIEVKNG